MTAFLHGDNLLVPMYIDEVIAREDGFEVYKTREGLRVPLNENYSWANPYNALWFPFDDGEMRLEEHSRWHPLNMGGFHKEDLFKKVEGIWVNQGPVDDTLSNEKFFSNSYGQGTEEFRAFEVLSRMSKSYSR